MCGRKGFFKPGISLNSKLGKELVRFSIPLMLTGIAGFVMTWTDTLMLGYYLVWNSHLKISNMWYAISVLIVFLVVYFFLILLRRSLIKKTLSCFGDKTEDGI